MSTHTDFSQSRCRTAILGVVLILLLPAGTQAALIKVFDLVDDNDPANGTCTLREAIRSANDDVSVDACTAGSTAVSDLIHVLPGTHVVDLSSGNDEDNAVTGDLDILGDVVIRGSSAEFSSIDGTGAGASDRLFHIHDTAEDVSIEHVALRGGNAADTSQRGGVLWNLESDTTPVQLLEVELSAGTAALGGGIANEGNLVILRSRILGNQTTVDPGAAGNHGGGIASSGMGAQLRIEDSEISGNQAEEDGAGLWVESGTLTLHRSRVTDNIAGGDGGALYVATSNYDVDYVEFSRNGADLGGGVYMAAQGEVQHSAFIDNTATTAGGGLYDSFGGFARFSTFSDNTAPTGAGVYADTAMTLLDSDTIARNNGAGVHNQSGVFFENTLIAENSGSNCTGNAPAFGAFNLEDTDTCGFVSAVDMPNFPNTEPMLGPLGDNGGPTPTLALLPGSPAIDVVTSEIRMNCEKMPDQRGYPRGRPRTQNVAGDDVFLCDLGAFEVTAPFVVDSLTDAVDDDLADDLCLTATGVCTLRAAIQQSNAIPDMNEIELGAGTHLLSIAGAGEDGSATGDLDIDPPQWIRGAGSGLTIVDGAGLDRVFDVGSPDAMASAAPNGTVIQDLEVTGGDAGADNGGGILARKDLRLEGVVVAGNEGDRGSAISSVATGPFFSFGDAVVQMIDSTVENNSGRSALFLVDARIEASSLIENTSSAPINGGAGEFLRVSLVNSTVAGNSAQATGAFFAGQAIVDSSTIYDNSTDFAPGGVFLLELSVFRNSIVAGNLVAGTPDNCSSNSDAITSLGYNVTDTAASDCELADPTDQTQTDPLLDVLAANGGPTRTHLPLTGSPVVDTGDDAHCPATDQRGNPRPADGDENGSFVCDVGAVELPEPSLLMGLLAGGLTLAGLARQRERRSRHESRSWRLFGGKGGESLRRNPPRDG